MRESDFFFSLFLLFVFTLCAALFVLSGMHYAFDMKICLHSLSACLLCVYELAVLLLLLLLLLNVCERFILGVWHV